MLSYLSGLCALMGAGLAASLGFGLWEWAQGRAWRRARLGTVPLLDADSVTGLFGEALATSRLLAEPPGREQLHEALVALSCFLETPVGRLRPSQTIADFEPRHYLFRSDSSIGNLFDAVGEAMGESDPARVSLAEAAAVVVREGPDMLLEF